MIVLERKTCELDPSIHDIQLLKNIVFHFDLRKYLFKFIHSKHPLNLKLIEALIDLNGQIIDKEMFLIILNNYSSFMDVEHKWLEKIFENNRKAYSNYDYAQWIYDNMNKFKKFYIKIEEFYFFSYPERKICDYFFSLDFFSGRLAEPSHMIPYFHKNYESLILKNKQIMSKVIDYVFQYHTHSAFKEILKSPENCLLKLHLAKKVFPKSVDHSLKLALKFKNHEIMATIQQLLEAQNWDDLPDFYAKLTAGDIPLEDIKNIKIKKISEILASRNIISNLYQCFICLESPEELQLLQECSHVICLLCLKNCLGNLKLNYEFKVTGNKNMFYLNNPLIKVKCPKCQKNLVVNSELTAYKIFP